MKENALISPCPDNDFATIHPFNNSCAVTITIESCSIFNSFQLLALVLNNNHGGHSSEILNANPTLINMTEEDYYKILSIEPTAPQEEVLEAATKLAQIWNAKRKRGEVSPTKHDEIQKQIRRATVVLTDPSQRLEYDMKQKIGKYFTENTRGKMKASFVLARPSESRESLPTIKIPGELDYEKLRSLTATQSPSSIEMGLEMPLYSRLNLAPGVDKNQRCYSAPQSFRDRSQVNKYPDKSASEVLHLRNYSQKHNIRGYASETREQDLETEEGEEKSSSLNSMDRKNDMNGHEITDSLNDEHSKVRTSDDDIDEMQSQPFNNQSESQEKSDLPEYNTELALERKVQSTSNVLEPKSSVVGSREVTSERNLSYAKDASIEHQERDSENDLDSRVKGFEIKYVDSYKLLKDKYSGRQRSPSQTASSDLKVFRPSRMPLEEGGSKISNSSSFQSHSKKDPDSISSDPQLKEHHEEPGSKGIRHGSHSKRLQNAVGLLEDIAIFPSVMKVPLEDFHSKKDVTALESSNEGETNTELDPTPKDTVSERLMKSISKETSEKLLDQVRSLNDNFKQSIYEADSISKHHKSDSEMLHQPVEENYNHTMEYANNLRQYKSETFLPNKDDVDVTRSFETSSNAADDHEDESINSDTIGRRKLSKVGKKVIVKDWRDYWNPAHTAITATKPGPNKSVSATTRISGSDIRTVYTFGPDTELIEVFVNGEIRARIFQGESQDVYSNDMARRSEDGGPDICASTVIAANDCTVTTEVTRRGPRDSIAVYKNEVLLCRTGNTVVPAE